MSQKEEELQEWSSSNLNGNPRECICICTHLADLFEGLSIEVGEDVAVWLGENLKGHSAVVVLQWRNVIVPHCQLSPRIYLIPATQEKGKEISEDRKGIKKI